MADSTLVAVHAGYPLRDRMNEIRASLPNPDLLKWDQQDKSWKADLAGIEKANPAAHAELKALTTPAALEAKNRANEAYLAERAAAQGSAPAPAADNDRMRLFTSKDDYEQLKQSFRDRGLDGVMKWDARKATKGPYIDLTHPKIGDVDLKDLARFTTSAAKTAFEKGLAEAREKRNSENAEVRAQATGGKRVHLDRGNDKRIDLYPAKAANDEMRGIAKAAGADGALKWDNREASRGFYLDLTHADAGKLDLKAFEKFRTPEAKATFEKELAEAAERRARDQATVKAAGAEAASARTNGRDRREIPAAEVEYANKPLWMPHEREKKRYDAALAELKSMATPTLVGKFLRTEEFINKTRQDEQLLKEHGRALASDVRMQFLAALKGKEVLREVLVEDRGLTGFRAKGAKAETGASQGTAEPGQTKTETPAAKAAAPGPETAPPAAEPAAATSTAAKAAVLSEAARVASRLGR